MSDLTTKLRELCAEYGLTERHGFAWAASLAKRTARLALEEAEALVSVDETALRNIRALAEQLDVK